MVVLNHFFVCLNSTSEVGWLYLPLLSRFWLFPLRRLIGVWFLKLFAQAFVSGLMHLHVFEWISMEHKVQCNPPISTIRAIESRWLLMLSNRSCSTVLCSHTTISLRSVASGRTHQIYTHIYIYIYKTILSKATFSAFRIYIFFSVCVFPGNRRNTV